MKRNRRAVKFHTTLPHYMNALLDQASIDLLLNKNTIVERALWGYLRARRYPVGESPRSYEMRQKEGVRMHDLDYLPPWVAERLENKYLK